jgi:hypothetical protein
MSRWTVFDEAAAAAARERGEVDVCAGSDASPAVTEALQRRARVVAVFPTRDPGKAIVMRIERRREAVAAPASPPAAEATAAPERVRASADEPRASYAPGGFLGLSDELVLEEEPPKPKKWWRKLLD